MDAENGMPAWLLWLSPLPLATLGAIAWTSWTSRSRGPAPAIDSVEGFERFRSALTNPLPSSGQPSKTEARSH